MRWLANQIFQIAKDPSIAPSENRTPPTPAAIVEVNGRWTCCLSKGHLDPAIEKVRPSTPNRNTEDWLKAHGTSWSPKLGELGCDGQNSRPSVLPSHHRSSRHLRLAPHIRIGRSSHPQRLGPIVHYTSDCTHASERRQGCHGRPSPCDVIPGDALERAHWRGDRLQRRSGPGGDKTIYSTRGVDPEWH
jgi:hypothetical protein